MKDTWPKHGDGAPEANRGREDVFVKTTNDIHVAVNGRHSAVSHRLSRYTGYPSCGGKVLLLGPCGDGRRLSSWYREGAPQGKAPPVFAAQSESWAAGQDRRGRDEIRTATSACITRLSRTRTPPAPAGSTPWSAMRVYGKGGRAQRDKRITAMMTSPGRREIEDG